MRSIRLMNNCCALKLYHLKLHIMSEIKLQTIFIQLLFIKLKIFYANKGFMRISRNILLAK